MTTSMRDQAEIRRSASEAAKAAKASPKTADLDRYVNPPASTPYGLEYAHHLLGDVRGKTVLDLGCGLGGNIPALVARGAHVVAIDISPELIEIARRRIPELSSVYVRSAYSTELPDEAVDVIFCIALIHHLDIPRVRDEMRRILKPGGYVILKEPIRFSETYGRLRKLFPEQVDVSPFEHPLTRDELKRITEAFQVEGLRYFRLPFVPLIVRVFPSAQNWLIRSSDWLLKRRIGEKYGTEVVARLMK